MSEVIVYLGNGETEMVSSETAGLVYSGRHDQYIWRKTAAYLSGSSEMMVNHEYDLAKEGRFINEFGEAELYPMVVWDGCDSYILSNLPVHKGSEVFNPSPAIKTNIDPTGESADLESCVLIDGVVYQLV